MKQYLDLLKHVYENGTYRSDRTGTGTYSVFGSQMRFDLKEGFPLVTTKKVYTRGVIAELLWFISGNTNINWLVNNDVHIWDEWADEHGNLGNVYGAQWRRWETHNHNKIVTYPRKKNLPPKHLSDFVDDFSEIKNVNDDIKAIHKLWLSMMRIEKETSFEEYRYFVSSEWRTFSNFLNDVSNVPYFYSWLKNKEEYQILDFYGSHVLGRDTVIFSNRNIEINSDNDTEDTVVRPQLVIDQLSELVNGLKNNPDSRRHILSAWNVPDINEMALPPCHCLVQFYAANGKLSCQLYQRSADIFLGVPFNIASYALLTHMLAQSCDLDVGDFIWTGGDVHLYANHKEQAEEQLKRNPLPLPTLKLNPNVKSVFDFQLHDIEIEGYKSHPAIKAKVAV